MKKKVKSKYNDIDFTKEILMEAIQDHETSIILSEYTYKLNKFIIEREFETGRWVFNTKGKHLTLTKEFNRVFNELQTKPKYKGILKEVKAILKKKNKSLF